MRSCGEKRETFNRMQGTEEGMESPVLTEPGEEWKSQRQEESMVCRSEAAAVGMHGDAFWTAA